MKNKQAKENYQHVPSPSPPRHKTNNIKQFDNIINRSDLLTLSPQKRIHQFTPTKKKPIYPEQNPIKYQRSFKEKNSQPKSAKENTQNKDVWARKEGGSRRRQYDMRMENIQKMTSQISNLLDYVKTGEYKKQNKNDCQVPSRSITPKNKTKDEITHMHRNSYIDSLNEANEEKDDRFRQADKTKKKYEFITEGAKEKNKSRRKLADLEKEKQPRYQMMKKNIEIQRKQSPLKKYAYDNFTHTFQPKTMQKKPINSMILQEDKRNQLKPNIQVKKEDVKLSKFKYGFQTPNDSLNEIAKSEYSSMTDRMESRKMTTNYSNIDEEISKIKSRIQCSEQKTKKMEERYLNTSERQTFKSYLEVDDRSKVKEVFYDREMKSRFDEISQPKTNTFELKVYPCQTSLKQKITTKIAQNLVKQVKLDQNLRISREKFAFLQKNDKWSNLSKILSERGYHYSEDKLKQELTISSNEYNPFGSQSRSTNYFQEIAEAFIRSENCWKNDVEGCVRRAQLSESGFKVEEMDLDKKGYLGVQDFVCFVNLNSSNFFRNRDIMTLFKRFMAKSSNKMGVSYNTIQAKICM